MSIPATSAYPACGGPKPRSGLAVHGLRRTALRHHDEADLSFLHHAQALSGDPLDVGGVVELLDLSGEPGVLLFEELGLLLQPVQALALGHIGASGNHEIE